MSSQQISDLIISSSTFIHGKMIPQKYSCNGQQIHPPLDIDQIPANTRSLVIIMEDPDAPKGTFTHWLAWNIPPSGYIAEGTSPGIQGINSAGKLGYTPPCPPSGTHRYYIHVYALDTELAVYEGETRQILEHAMSVHVIAKGTLMGRYQQTEKVN